VRFNPSGSQILVASNGQDLKVFEVDTGALVATLKNTRRGTFSTDGSLVFGGSNGHLMIWNAKNWEVLQDLPNNTGSVTSGAADSQHDLAPIGGWESARIIKLTTGAEITKLESSANFVGINNTGTLIFANTSRGLAIWDATGHLRCLKPGNGYYAMAISPD